jgi:RNA polymerase sigma-70 factor (ECF subfamily)
MIYRKFNAPNVEYNEIDRSQYGLVNDGAAVGTMTFIAGFADKGDDYDLPGGSTLYYAETDTKPLPGDGHSDIDRLGSASINCGGDPDVLHNVRLAAECVNDTWLSAWNAMPDKRPGRLGAFLARITRNGAISKALERNRLKRGGGQVPLVLDELAECVAAPGSVEEEISGKLLWEHIRAFLSHEPENVRRAFLLRYALALPFDEIAERLQMSAGAVRISLHRTRKKLKQYLKQEGWL